MLISFSSSHHWGKGMVLELLLLQALAEKAEEEEACVGRREEGGEDTVE